MKINKLEIGSFGKFKNYQLELKDGFQIVYGKNEDGKSTLMAFIKMMFYSKLATGRDINKNIRKKYQPWDGSSMNGAVEFEYSGVTYRLQKDIGATPSADKVKLINMATGKSIPLGKNEEVGKKFFGLDLSGFERSVFISQVGNFSASSNNDEVADKLMSNLVLSGDEDISQQLVMKRLTDAIEDMESKNRKKGILVDARNELDALRNARAEVQILEQEQRENMKEYDLLEKKQKEKKNIQILVKLNEEKIKFEQLSALINQIVQRYESEQNLEKENFPYSSLSDFLKDCKFLIHESEKTKGTLEKLKGSTEGKAHEYNLIPISEEEYTHLKQLIDQEKIIKNLLKRIDESFIPMLRSYKDAKNNHQNVEALLKQESELVDQLKKFHEDTERYEKIAIIKIKEKEDLLNHYEKDKVQWKSEKELREERIKSANEKLAIQKTIIEPRIQSKAKKNPLLIFSIILGIVSILLMVIHPLAAIGVVLAVVMGLFALKSNKQSITIQKRSSSSGNPILVIEQELEKLREENDKQDQIVVDHRKNYDDALLALKNEIDEAQKQIESLAEKNNAYQISLSKYSELTEQKDKVSSTLEFRYEAYCQERNALLKDYASDLIMNEEMNITTLQSEELDEIGAKNYRDHMESLYNGLEIKIEEAMKGKSCTSLKEYEDKFYEYASESKNRDVISQGEREFEGHVNKFLDRINEYEVVQNYGDAKDFVKNLDEKITQLEKKKEETHNIAKGMGYDTSSLDYLMQEIEKLKPSVSELEAMGETGFSIEEMYKKLEDPEYENIEQEILDLQKKIKTPEKNLSQIQIELEEMESSVKEKSSYFNCLKIAAEVMQEASDEMRQSFGPELNKKTATIFKNLTKGKYENILVTKDYDISIQTGIHYREWKYLSNGTVDQAYLALRLAIAELISDKNMVLPLFLDDVLMQYDDERIDAALNFIADYVSQKDQDFQLLLFTCHQHIIESAKGYTDQVVNIDENSINLAWNMV